MSRVSKSNSAKQNIPSANLSSELNVQDASPQLIENVAEPQNVVEPALVESPGVIDTHFDQLYTTLSIFKQSLATLQQNIKLLEKDMKKEIKSKCRAASKKQKGHRKPSGFAKPADVSTELCDFMGRQKGSQIARTEVTQYIIQYIKENELQYENNKKVILPDDRLKKLLGVDNKTEVTYFNLQGLMNRHFVPNA
tara:strand:+ start:1817 stop:2401 length:585 start_codon:yes stop_codon:yes gene_type:complete